MKRPTYTPGSYYHLYNRGRSRLSIFHDPKDYHQVLELMKTYSQKYSLVIIAYCLLANHYHFVQEHFPQPGAYQEFVREYLLSRHHPEGMEYLDEW